MELTLFLTEAYIKNENLEVSEYRKLEKVFLIFLLHLQEFIALID